MIIHMAMAPNQTPGASEYSHGPGLFPHPNVDYSDSGKKNLAPVAEPSLQDQLLDMLMYKRLDAADPDAKQHFEGPEARGNTDRFGPAPAPVKTPGITLGPTQIAEEPLKMKRAD